MSNLNSRHIVKYLKELCPLIMNEQLAESSAYTLLLTVTKGETYNLVMKSMNSGVLFLQIWDLLYTFRPQKKTKEEISFALEKVLKERPKNLILVLHQIIGLWDCTGDNDDLFKYK